MTNDEVDRGVTYVTYEVCISISGGASKQGYQLYQNKVKLTFCSYKESAGIISFIKPLMNMIFCQHPLKPFWQIFYVLCWLCVLLRC